MIARIESYIDGGGFVRNPCGVYKLSGYGREQGIEALAHYTQIKSVIVKL